MGSLRSRRSVVLRPEVSGRITQLNFTDGQRVKKGQALVQFDDQLQRAQVQQSQAELAIALANQKRYQELVAQASSASGHLMKVRPICRSRRPNFRWPKTLLRA